MRTTLSLAAVLAVASALPVAGFAADPGFFIGVSVGQSYLEATEGNLSIDDESTSYQIQASYNFSERWGVQAAYQRVGDFDENDIEVDLNGFEVNGMISHNINQAFSVHGRAGVIVLESDSRLTSTGATADDSEPLAVLTLGGNLKADENLSFNAEGKYIADSDADIYLLQIGLQGKFGSANNR